MVNTIIIPQYKKTGKFCSFCNDNLEIECGTTLYDKNWYHNKCWSSFEKEKGGCLY